MYICWQMDGLISGGGLKPGGALKWDFMVFVTLHAKRGLMKFHDLADFTILIVNT